MKNHTVSVALVLLLTACASQQTSTSPSAEISPSAEASPSADASQAAADALTGTWATEETTCEEQNAAVEAAGFTAEEMEAGGWDPTCSQGTPHGSQFTLRFESDTLVVFLDGAADSEGIYRIVDEDTFEGGDEANGFYYTCDFAIDGDVLTIDMVEDNYPVEAERTGDAIALTVIAETAPFTRVP
jgi:hypothetical protein